MSRHARIWDGGAVCLTAADAEQSALPALRVLVVDRDNLHRMIICRAADKAGCVPAGAANLTEAIKHVQSAAFDCITLDLSFGRRAACDFLSRLDALGNPVETITQNISGPGFITFDENGSTFTGRGPSVVFFLPGELPGFPDGFIWFTTGQFVFRLDDTGFTMVVEPRISTKTARPPPTTAIRNAVVRPAGFFEVARISRAITVTITSSIATTTCQVTWVILFSRENVRRIV